MMMSVTLKRTDKPVSMCYYSHATCKDVLSYTLDPSSCRLSLFLHSSRVDALAGIFAVNRVRVNLTVLS